VSYEVVLLRDAEKDIRKLKNPTLKRVYTRLSALSDDPRGSGAVKLREDPAYRVRVGLYRILYDIDDEARTVSVLGVRHRREAYKKR
jgi:mRNA interferase RelE/StbE